MSKLMSLELIGDDALKAVLSELKDSTVRKVMRQGLRPAMRPVRQEAKRLAPKRSGALGKSLAIKVHTSKRTGDVTGMVGVRHNFEANGRIPNLYAQRIEFGWSHKSMNNPRSSKTYPKMPTIKQIVNYELGGSSHPARPFLRPAMASKKHEALGILGRKSKDVLRREVDKLSAKGKRIK